MLPQLGMKEYNISPASSNFVLYFQSEYFALVGEEMMLRERYHHVDRMFSVALEAVWRRFLSEIVHHLLFSCRPTSLSF